MKIGIGRSLLSAILAAIAICLAAAFLIVCLIPLFDSILSENKPAVNSTPINKTIILDPGHGGMDSGAVGIGGSYEKDLNLSVSLIMRDLLTAMGYTVVMTREDDRLLYDESVNLPRKSQDLKNRLAYQEKYPDALFVSIHMNKFPVEKYSGLEVYYSPNNPLGREFAETIRSAVKEQLQTENNREIKAATSAIYILDRIQIPAILVECGFLSNYAEETLLQDAEYQKKLAAVLCSAIHNQLADENGGSDSADNGQNAA